LVTLKGVDVLLRALASFEQKIAQDWRLEIVGDGQDRQSLEILARELNLQEKVHFLGSQDREWVLYHFLPSIDIFVNPSFQEGLPTTVLEALLAKCVVVASDVGGTKEISDACDLFLLKPGNVDDLIKMLVHSVCLLSKK
jgi:glycosyltransferase involved in cell wall biosynthesis